MTQDFSLITHEVRRAAGKRIIYTEHALDKMNAEEEMLAFTEKGRPVHIVCAPKEDYLGIITAYVPTEEKWEADFKTRKKKEGDQ